MLEHLEHEEDVDRLFQPTPNDGPPLLWLKSQARYVRAMLNGRALVTAWLPGGRLLNVEAVLAVRDQSVVLQGHLDEGAEVHVSLRTDEVILEMRAAPEGTESTLFAFIGVSRTPQPLLPRLTETPPPRGHHHRPEPKPDHDHDHDH